MPVFDAVAVGMDTEYVMMQGFLSILTKTFALA